MQCLKISFPSGLPFPLLVKNRLFISWEIFFQASESDSWGDVRNPKTLYENRLVTSNHGGRRESSGICSNNINVSTYDNTFTLDLSLCYYFHVIVFGVTQPFSSSAVGSCGFLSRCFGHFGMFQKCWYKLSRPPEIWVALFLDKKMLFQSDVAMP